MRRSPYIQYVDGGGTDTWSGEGVAITRTDTGSKSKMGPVLCDLCVPRQMPFTCDPRSALEPGKLRGSDRRTRLWVGIFVVAGSEDLTAFSEVARYSAVWDWVDLGDEE
jgi:hypothetical protein